MRYQVDFFFHRNQKKYYPILDYDPKIPLDYQLARYFTFDLFDLLILIPGVHCYIVLARSYIAYFYFYFIREYINQTDTITSFAFEIQKMRFRTFLAQPVSILGLKIQKVVTGGGGNLFLFVSRQFFSKYTIFVLVTFFSHLVVIQST